jgi:hypothetical protein
MIRKALTATCIVALAWFAVVARAGAADAPAVFYAAPAAPKVARVQDCSRFYDPYRRRGFGWGSGPGLGVGFGTFEGALPMYPLNEFPNWYGACVTWGHYSATGTAR